MGRKGDRQGDLIGLPAASVRKFTVAANAACRAAEKLALAEACPRKGRFVDDACHVAEKISFPSRNCVHKTVQRP
jgi:hypothetical protein